MFDRTTGGELQWATNTTEVVRGLGGSHAIGGWEGGAGVAWDRTGHRAEREKGTVSSVTTAVSRVSGDTGKSHDSRFVSGVTGVSGATVAPETDHIFC